MRSHLKLTLLRLLLLLRARSPSSKTRRSALVHTDIAYRPSGPASSCPSKAFETDIASPVNLETRTMLPLLCEKSQYFEEKERAWVRGPEEKEKMNAKLVHSGESLPSIARYDLGHSRRLGDGRRDRLGGWARSACSSGRLACRRRRRGWFDCGRC